MKYKYLLHYSDTSNEDDIQIANDKALIMFVNNDRKNFYGRQYPKIKDVFLAMYYLDTRDIEVTVF